MTLLGTRRISVMGLIFPDYPTPPYPVGNLEALRDLFIKNVNEQGYGKVTAVPGPTMDWQMMPSPLGDPKYGMPLSGGQRWIPQTGTMIDRAWLEEAFPFVTSRLGPGVTDAVAVAVNGLGNCGFSAGFAQFMSAGPNCGFGGRSGLVTLLHETAGHSWGGLLHSGSLNCWPAGTWAPRSLTDHYQGGQIWQSYGDGDDPQGGGTSHFHVENTLKLGWIELQQIVTAEQGNHTYTLAPLENGQGVMGLRIPLDATHWYTLEYRAQGGPYYGPGVFVRLHQDANVPGSYADDSLLLKMQKPGGYQYVAVPDRVSMEDPYRGIRFTLKSRNAQGAMIQVKR